MTAYRVYVLCNAQARHYIGVSSDPEKRLAQHNTGVSRWAGSNGPWNLIWMSAPQSLGAARKLENLLKRQKGGAGFYRLTGLQRDSR